jgi:hypothetical protein
MKNTSLIDQIAYPLSVLGAFMSAYVLFFCQTATIIAPENHIAIVSLVALIGTIGFVAIALMLRRKIKRG